eukprot:3932663-Rhodomonas_salina.1
MAGRSDRACDFVWNVPTVKPAGAKQLTPATTQAMTTAHVILPAVDFWAVVHTILCNPQWPKSPQKSRVPRYPGTE